MKQQPKIWTKPELAKLGKLADVAGPAGRGIEAGPNARS
jgi:hypothetical protein